MAKKKVKKGKTVRVSGAKRASKISRKKSSRPKKVVGTKGKVKIILKNLILFGVLFILSSILYRLSGTNEILSNFFWILALVTGGLAMAFVIAYFVSFFIKLFKK